MFEEKTFDALMAEMMDDEPDGINTQEGTLIYNACAKLALKLEEIYIGMNYIEKNTSPATMDDEHIVEYAKERGITQKEASHTVLLGKFGQEIEIGTRFTLNDLNYIVTEATEGFNYKVRCETAGKTGNNYLGELAPITYIDDWQGGELTKVLIPGEDAEDAESIRQKVMYSYDSKAFAGNQEAYKQWFRDQSGIGGCKINRRKKSSKYIYATIIDSEFKMPSEELIQEIQTKIDPEQNHGEGVGYAPIGHSVIVQSVEPVAMNLEMNLIIHESYTKQDLLPKIETVLDTYFLDLAKTWEKEKQLIVRVFEIMVRFAKIEGITDITNMKVNEMSESIVLEENQIPVRGSVHAL